MTRGEHRAKCIEAMKDAINKIRDKWAQDHRWVFFYDPECPMELQVAAAFDALPTVGARVVPIEATEEIVKSVYRADVETCDDCQWPSDHKTGINLATAAADLTNPPETKPHAD